MPVNLSKKRAALAAQSYKNSKELESLRGEELATRALALPAPCQYAERLAVKVVRTIAAIRRLRRAARGPAVLVPTMGALHAGHAALIARARKLAGKDGQVIVSIFVNPTQFGPREDLSRYPRPFAADRRLCEGHGADAIFYPTTTEIYPDDFSTFVEERSVSTSLCGASRPGHFQGVCTVVLKLFTITGPDIAVFGQKDFQQCAVIRRLVRDLDLPIRIAAVPTVREEDGLAMSSRNSYLTPDERAQAPVIRRALIAAKTASKTGERNASRLRHIVARAIAQSPSARVDYIEVVDANSMQPVRETVVRSLIATAVYFGRTRLIDNILL